MFKKILIGLLLLAGLGFANDDRYEREYKVSKEGCDAGNAKACFDLGALYLTGLGVERDISKVPKLYKKGCDGGIAEACDSLGVFYSNYKQDTKGALKYFRKGCEMKNEDACRHVRDFTRR